MYFEVKRFNVAQPKAKYETHNQKVDVKPKYLLTAVKPKKQISVKSIVNQTNRFQP